LGERIEVLETGKEIKFIAEREEFGK